MATFDLDHGLLRCHVMITGGAGMIGSVTVEAFLAAGSRVTVVDLDELGLSKLEARVSAESAAYKTGQDIHYVIANIASEDDIEAAFTSAESVFGPVQCCVALASLDLSVLPHHQSIVDMPYEQWKSTFDVNVHGTFLTARTWLRHLALSQTRVENPVLILVGSESGAFGERGNADYASTKSAVQVGLLQSLKADVPRVYPGAR